jgi:hypothetical protein
MKLDSGFEIVKFSDAQYEAISVELRHNGIPVAQINKDKGNDSIEIEIPYRFSPENVQFLFNMDDFIIALEKSKKYILDL